jgi:long-chain acyl-CoA synthetase
MAETLPAILLAQAERLADRPALLPYDGAGPPLTWRDWTAAVNACAGALLAAGHASGERIAIFAGNRMIWPIADLAALSLGMVSVGVFPTAAPAQVAELLADAGATAVFVDSPERLAAVLAARAQARSVRTIVCESENGALPDGVVSWHAWLNGNGGAPAEDVLTARIAALRTGDDAIAIYTSGSTGTPKGALLSHGNLVASARSIRGTLGLGDGERMISFLPFSHAAERVFGQTTRIVTGASALLLDDYTQLWSAASAYAPTTFGGLPRFYEKIALRLESVRDELPAAERRAWDEALTLGYLRSSQRQRGEPVSAELERKWRAAAEPLRATIASCLGDAVRLATSGGAALPSTIAALLDAAGLTVYGAYGLTEHLCVASHRPGRYGFDGVGPAMDGTRLRIAADGEILVRRCALTFTAYLDRGDETRAMFTADGEWLLTGDLGRLDEHGDLHVTGRKKELIALSTGKKVAPLAIEAKLTQHHFIAQAMLYGEGRNYLTGLLAVRRDEIERWARARRITTPYPALLECDEVRAEIAAFVAAVNGTISSPERVRRYALLERELSTEHDELTPTLKIRRSVVADRFRDRLDALYREAL